MREKDIRRYELLQKVTDGRLTLSQVTEALGVSYRQAKRLKARVIAQGLAGLCHGNWGRPPHNRSAETLRERVLALSKERYFDFNDSHFTEMLKE
ncbi:MAG: helix-turn-helix domain-containing protein, partial [Dehalococcoidia bacterium]|nr:helix-turn-helix domain-containing protein [Dehalococcoidia bacterium]